MTEDARLAALLAAEQQAQALFDAIEAAGFIRAGRNERDVEKEIYNLAEQSFGVTKHWHKRIVRSGPNTLTMAADNPPVRDIADGDTVFIDLGPVFDEWEADVGRTYVLGDDPRKQQLRPDLERIFDELKQYFDDHRRHRRRTLRPRPAPRRGCRLAVRRGDRRPSGGRVSACANSGRQGSVPHQPGQSGAHAGTGCPRPAKALDHRSAPCRPRPDVWRVLRKAVGTRGGLLTNGDRHDDRRRHA